MTEPSQAECLPLHEYHDTNHNKLGGRDTLCERFLVNFFPRKGKVHSKGVDHAGAQLGRDGCRLCQPGFHGLVRRRYSVCRKSLDKIDNRSQPTKVAPTSTAPVKGSTKAIVADYLGLDFVDEVGPGPNNRLQAFCYVSAGRLERVRSITYQQVSVTRRAGLAGDISLSEG